MARVPLVVYPPGPTVAQREHCLWSLTWIPKSPAGAIRQPAIPAGRSQLECGRTRAWLRLSEELLELKDCADAGEPSMSLSWRR